MDIKKLAPWNWFKKEDEDAGKTIPVQHPQHQTGFYLPGNPLDQFHHNVDRLFDNLLQGFGLSPFRGGGSFWPRLLESVLKPTLDIASTDQSYNISVELPGVDENDMKLELLNGTLTIRGEKKYQKEQKDKNHYCVERSYGSFQRVLNLPEDMDESDIKASYAKGVLNITIPRKALPKTEVKQIQVKAAA
jgi:HSP20 family protein